MRRTRARTGSGKPRRPMDWENGRVSCLLPPVNTYCADWVVLPSVLRDYYTDPTLMASRWFVAFGFVSGLIEILPGAVLGVGLITWNSKDDTIPANAPLPLADGELDWINRFIVPIPQFYDASETDYFSNELDIVHLSKAKRRLGQDSGILLVAEVKLVTNEVSFSADVRCLIKE